MSKRTARSDEPLRCPKCGSKLLVEQLVVEDESGSETLFFIDCPRGDFNLAVTDKEVVTAVASIVTQHLKEDTSLSPSSDA